MNISKKTALASMLALSLMTACQAENVKNSISDVAPVEYSFTDLSADAPILVPDTYYAIYTKSKYGELLSIFTTKFNANNKPRVTNLTLAAGKLNGIVLKPNETFSYNDTLGPTNKANGYKLAKIFIKGKESKGYGGGVCQVSSTLYNAAKKANMEIIERHAHSKPVGYVKEGDDAATSYGSIDFKFKNNKTYPIILSSRMEEGSVSVAINKAVNV